MGAIIGIVLLILFGVPILMVLPRPLRYLIGICSLACGPVIAIITIIEVVIAELGTAASGE